jgi:hypothetical protein
MMPSQLARSNRRHDRHSKPRPIVDQLACRHCHKLSYASRQLDSITRKRLAAAKLRLNLGGLPDINEAIAPKAKRKHRRSYNKARKHIDRLEAPIKAYRFRKPLSTQLFAYHVS